MNLACDCCGGAHLRLLEKFAALPRTSSDCKPFPSGGALAECARCGHLQKPVTAAFLGDIERIYADYDMYYQGGGLEQIVYDDTTQRPTRRSDLLSRRLLSLGVLPPSGTAIDLGCGNGGFVRALGERFAGWRFHGMELDWRHEAALSAIPGFERLVVGDIEELDGRYELISMIHALEHFSDPVATLTALRRNLSERGVLFIQVPNVAENPFDLVIVDHVSHLTPGTLPAMLHRAGYAIAHLAEDWVRKELSVLARPIAAQRAPGPSSPAGRGEAWIAWLGDILARALAAAALGRDFGIFGTSIAATWLSSALGDRVAFYLDDDPARQFTRFFGKPVLPPADAPDNATIFVALAPIIAETVAGRLRTRRREIVIPPPMPQLGPRASADVKSSVS